MVKNSPGLAKKHREQLLLAEERFRVVAQATSDVIWDWDLETNSVWWNDNVCTVLGYRKQDVGPDATWWYQNIHEDDRERVVSGIHAAIDGGDRHWSAEYRYRRGDGSYAFIFDRGYVLRDARKKPKRMVGAMIDLTERKRAQESLLSAQQQLIQSQKMEAIGRLAGGIAHDFNNVMTAIIGHTDLLLRDCSPAAPTYHNLAEISKAGQRAVSLTRQLLAFSRKQVLSPRVLNLNRVVVDMENMLRRLIGEDIEFCHNLQSTLHNVKADPGQIEQVILNLAVNARDAMPKGGKLTIETANVDVGRSYFLENPAVKPGPYVMLAVADTGCGMDEATRLKIFEPFFTTKEPGKGTGLGLSTVFGIIKQSGGHVLVDSAPGVGSTFRIYLPGVEDERKARSRPKVRRSSLHGTEKILLAEDDSALRPLLSKVLREGGYGVVEANNGEEALRQFKKHAGSINLVLSDIVMPLLNGPELQERVRRISPDVPVLLMSGHTDEAIIHKRTLNGMMNLIQKPFAPEELLREIRAVLDRPPKRRRGNYQI